MKTKFQCPPAFDVNAARVYLISPQFKDDFAGKPHISVMELNGKQKPAYLSAMGKVWTEIPLPSEVLFEEVVHDCNGGGNYVKHFHTQFEIAKHIVHVDYVLAWSYGPGTAQTHVMIYVDGNLETSAIRGGGSFGASWQRRWPVTLIVEGLLLRFIDNLNFENSRVHFKPGDEDSPLIVYHSVSREAVPFHVFDFTDAAFIEHKLIPSLNVNAVDHLFYYGASDEDKKAFLSDLLKRGRGHFVSEQALREIVSLEIFSNCLGFLNETCVFKENGGRIEGTDFELNEYRTGELTNYFRELLLRVQPISRAH